MKSVGEGAGLRGRRVLVTGAAGMIGANLVRRVIADGADVVAVVRPGGSRQRLEGLEDSLRVIEADLADDLSIRLAVAEVEPAVVFHLGSTIWARTPSTDRRHFEVNVLGMLSLLEALRDRPSTRLVFTGSSSAYGAGMSIREQDAVRPGSVYGVTKAAASLLLQTVARQHGLSTVELRLFMPYGPWEHRDRLVPYTILAALEGRDVRMTTGLQQRDLIYMDDVIEALIRAAARPIPPGSVINIGSGQPVTVLEVVERILRLMGNPVKALPGTVPMRPDEIMHMSADITVARRLLGWEPATPLDEGLRRTIAWFQAQDALVRS